MRAVVGGTWPLLFAAAHYYWAAGGRLGVPGIARVVTSRPWFLAYDLAAGLGFTVAAAAWVYVAWRKIARLVGRSRRTWPLPNQAPIAGFVVALALVTWVVRIRYPVGKWVPLLFVLPAEPATCPST